MKEIFYNVFTKNRLLYTLNQCPGQNVYGEKLVNEGKKEYRTWDPYRSKLAATMFKGLSYFNLKPDSSVLYLGASTGTTVSHISDIKSGMVYAVEFSERMMRNLLTLSGRRKNIMPLLLDARFPEKYSWIESVDMVYVDIADPQETEIAIRNAQLFLKGNGLLFIAVKSQSIDVTKDPSVIYKEESEKLVNSDFKILQTIDLEPYEKHHAMLVCSFVKNRKMTSP